MKTLAIKQLHTLLVKEGFCKPTVDERTTYDYQNADEENSVVSKFRELYIQTLSEGATWDRTTGVRLVPTGIVTPSAVIHLHEPKSNRLRPTDRPPTRQEQEPMKNQFEKAAFDSTLEMINHLTNKGHGIETQLPIPTQTCEKFRRAFNYLPKDESFERSDNLLIAKLLYLIFDHWSKDLCEHTPDISIDNFGFSPGDETWISFTYLNSGVIVLLNRIIVMDLTSRDTVVWFEDVLDAPPYPHLSDDDDDKVEEEPYVPKENTGAVSPEPTQTPQKGKETMPTASPTTAVVKIAELLTTYGLYVEHGVNPRRRSFNHTSTALLEPSVVAELKGLYRQALLEGVLLDTRTDVELRPHGIFTPGSIIHLWKFVEYPLPKTMAYFKGKRFEDLSLNEIKAIEFDIQQHAYPKNNMSNRLGEFWELFFTTELSNQGPLITPTYIAAADMAPVVWAVVLEECHPVPSDSQTHTLLEFNNPAHASLAKILKLEFINYPDHLQLLTPGVSLTLPKHMYPEEYKQLEALVKVKDIPSEDNPPSSEQLPQKEKVVDTAVNGDTEVSRSAKLNNLTFSAKVIIDHLIRGGHSPEEDVALRPDNVAALWDHYHECFPNVSGTPLTVTSMMTHVLTEYASQMCQYYPTVTIDIGDYSDATVRLGHLTIEFKLDGIIVERTVEPYMAVWWRDDGNDYPSPEIIKIAPTTISPAPTVEHEKLKDISEEQPTLYTPQQIETLLQRFYTLLTTHINLGHTQFPETASVSRVLSELSGVEGIENTLLENGLVINQVIGDDEHWELAGMFGPSRQNYGLPSTSVVFIRFVPKGDMNKLYLTFRE